MGGKLKFRAVDPRSSEALGLIAALSAELAFRYNCASDGAGNFDPEDVLVPRSAFVVGVLDERAVGCGAFRPMEQTVAEIKRMFVAPDFRRRGYGQAILADLERRAAEAGYRRVRLETGDGQPESIRLYERCGYRRISNYPPYVGDERSICFEKVLQTPMAE
jgi:putative acetyltransferase